jgi:hypothetical protein
MAVPRLRVFRWTPRPGWYLARGWRVLALKQGVDYDSWLVAR